MTTPKLAENVRGRGRHYRHPDTGELLCSVTNVLGALSKPALPRWAAKVVAEQAWALRGSLSELDEVEAIDMLKGSPWRSSGRAARRGDLVHEMLELTTTHRVGSPLTGEAAEYQVGIDAFLTDHEVVATATEVTLFGEGYAGTADLIGYLDGVAVILDYKTNPKAALYPEVALQLAALLNCERMVSSETGELVDAPEVQEAVAVAISPSGYAVRVVADTDRCYRAFRSLLDVWEWQHSDGVLLDWAEPRLVPHDAGE
jgi:hypothetical protein